MTWEGAIIKQLRTERNLSQKEFSKFLEIPLSTLRNWEQGSRIPPTYIIKLIKFKCKQTTKGTTK